MATVSMRDMLKGWCSLWSPDLLLEPGNEAFIFGARNKVHIINLEKNCTNVQRSLAELNKISPVKQNPFVGTNALQAKR